MFKVNDVIIYATQGVCKIVAMEEKSIGGIKKNYFVLKPVNDESATIFAPADNTIVLKRMRNVLSVEEINRLIDAMPNENIVWVDNDNERKELYKNIIASGDQLELIKMLKGIYIHKLEREAVGKRLHMSDERFFKDAEQALYNEFQYVLKLSNKEALMQYIAARIGEEYDPSAG